MTRAHRKPSRSEHEESGEKSKRDPIKDSDLISLSKTKGRGQKRKRGNANSDGKRRKKGVKDTGWPYCS